MKASSEIATVEQIEQSIHVLQGQRVLLDSDLAKLYQPVEKRRRGVFQPRQARSQAPRGSQNRGLSRGFVIASM